MEQDRNAIDRSSPLPLYYQVKQAIIAQIESGTLLPDDPIPAETSLCELCHVSRTTVRQAVNELVNEGYIYKIKNVGKFVSAPMLHSDLLDLYKVYDIEFSDMGASNVTMKVLKLEVRPATAKESKKLQIPEGQEILYILRQRCMGNIVAYYIESCLIYPLCKAASDPQKLEQQSLYTLLAKSNETKLGSISRDFEACSATVEEGALLEVLPGSPFLLCKNICYGLESGSPIIYDIVRYGGGKNKLSLTFKVESMY